METVIRGSEDKDAFAKRPWVLWIGMFILAILILASAAVAAINAPKLGWTALILLGGMALVGTLGLLSYLSNNRDKSDPNERRFADRGSPYSEAFFQNPQASLIVRDGKPAHANQAYILSLIHI